MSLEKLEHLQADLQRWKEDLAGTEEFDTKQQFLFNVIPFFQGLVSACYEEMGEQSSVLVELVENDMEDHTELAAMIASVIGTARAICKTIKDNDYKLDNDIVTAQLKKAIEDFDHNAVVVLNRVKDVLVGEWLDEEEEDTDEDQSQTDNEEQEEEQEEEEQKEEVSEAEVQDQPQKVEE